VRPEDAENLFDVVSRIIFGVAAGILMLLALLLIADVLVLYPTLLFVAAILLVVGLGVYQRLSAEVEERVGHRDRADHAKNSK
jgi:hypothetical protein